MSFVVLLPIHTPTRRMLESTLTNQTEPKRNGQCRSNSGRECVGRAADAVVPHAAVVGREQVAPRAATIYLNDESPTSLALIAFVLS